MSECIHRRSRRLFCLFMFCLFVCVLCDSPPVGHGLLIHEVSGSHTTTHHSRQDSSGRVISSSQRPLPDNTQHSQQTNIDAHGGIQIHNHNKRAAAVQRLRPSGHWDRQDTYLGSLKGHKTISQLNFYSLMNSGMTGS